MEYTIEVRPDKAVNLANIDTRENGGLEKAEGNRRLLALRGELSELQESLYAAGTHALLLVLQGMDTSGKDGTIRHVFKQVNPLGVRGIPFKTPTARELARDFLWRVHREVPEKGMIAVFNRSHYEDVVVVRVNDLVDERTWRGRYDDINAFERLLVDTGTIVVKCFLHISAEEQEERLRAREQDVQKAWKLSAGDWIERRNWDAYQAAYQDALNACSTKAAPWHIVPADRKWFRNLAVANLLVETLRPYREGWLAELERRGQEELAAIRAIRPPE
ncbi:MAG TPA: PPK2 family polyphosphate kinase [Thermomicrobiales bacterium]|nr:PPK2 family polyphosphate kinase [Thermomicrobiales bacterium]